ncbi:hypothetical protein [Streptomyces sp. NPDC059909]|uniref:hypothetical protein n=1 Tax=Streptomyces sp. NPDC059909 TaxID=3346998 RepID=UPI003667A1F7
MEREQIPERTDTGLSTEDLAQPRGGNAAEDTESRTGTPTFPGEATEPATETAPASDQESDQESDQQGATPVDEEPPPRLLTTEDEEGFRSRWQKIQNLFVDDPREAVHAADSLVADVMQQLAATFADHKQDLEEQWNRGEEANTEDLRMTLRKYRSFFNRLLTN